MQTRMKALAAIIASVDPDVIALQEVTAEHLPLIRAHPVLATYHWVEPDFSRQFYSTVIASKTGLVAPFRRIPFPGSGMARDVLIAEVLDSRGRRLTVATSHLESLQNAPKRQAQLGMIFRALSRVPDAIFCGDTNIDEGWEGETAPVLPLGWVDAWLELNKTREPGSPTASRDGTGSQRAQDDGKENGATFDVFTNGMVFHLNKFERERMRHIRYDRFFVKAPSYKLVSMEIVGNKPVAPLVYPSDHYGVVLTLE